MIGKLLRRIAFVILLAIVIAMISLLVSSKVTGTNQFDVLFAAVGNIIKSKQPEVPKVVKPIEVAYVATNLVTLQSSATFTLKVKTELKDSPSIK